MDEELKQLAALALRNAFWSEFSGLCNAYLKASKGLIDNQEEMMGELTSIYGRDLKSTVSGGPDIWSARANGGSCGHEDLVEALEFDEASRIYLCGKCIFTRRGEAWAVFDEEQEKNHQVNRAAAMLASAGYKVTETHTCPDGTGHLYVIDLIQCSSGKRRWMEEKQVRIVDIVEASLFIEERK